MDRLVRCSVVVAFLSIGCGAQEAPSIMNAKGNSPLALYSAGDFDNVNPVNGNVFLSIPIVSFPQRGHSLALAFNIYYNSNLWVTNWLSSGGADARWDWSEAGRTNVGAYIGRSQFVTTGVDLGTSSTTYSDSGRNTYTVSRTDHSTWAREASGAKHYIGDVIYGSCNDSGRGSCPSTYSTDQKWFSASDSTAFIPHVVQGSTLASVTDSAGNTYTWPNGYTTLSDTNGNQIVSSQNGWTDTVGRSIPGGTSSPGPNDNVDQNSTSSYSLQFAEPYPGTTAANVSSTSCPAGTSSARIWNVPGVSGSVQTYYFCYTQQTFQTAFNANTTKVPYYTFIEAKSSDSGFVKPMMLTAVVLPDKTSYTFAYDQFLSLTTMSLPTGGTITYQWLNLPYGSPLPSGNWPTPSRALQSRTVSNGSGSSQTWTYSYTTTGDSPANYTYWSVTTDPNGNDTEYQNGAFQTASKTVYSGCGPHNTSQTRTCSGSGSVVYQENYGYTPLAGGSSAGSLGADQATAAFNAAAWMQQRTSTTTTIGTGSFAVTKQSATQFPPKYGTCTVQYLPTSNPPQPPQSTTISGCIQSLAPSQITETDFGKSGSGSPGAALQTTTNTYQWQANGNYLSANLMNLIANTTIVDGAGNQVAATSYNYDESGSPQGAIGNNTSQIRWVGTGLSSVSTLTTFTSQGMPQSTTDGKGFVTTTAYDGTGMFPSSITHPATGSASHVENFQYDSATGGIMSYTDENSQQTSYAYKLNCGTTTSGTSFDPFARVQTITYPATSAGTAKKSYCYTDSTSGWSLTTTDPIGVSVTTSYDGLGRTTQVQNNSSGVIVSTQYDFANRPTFTSNPDLSLNLTGTTFAYDPIGRMTQQTNADGTTKGWSYQGAVTTATDEAGNQVQRQTDGMGRLTAVVEVQATGQTVCILDGGKSYCQPQVVNSYTSYGYSGLGNLTSVNQAGASGETPRNRSFSYDGLSRLVTATNPETGTVCYGLWSKNQCSGGYDANGNLVALTNADGTGTLFGYDQLNRLSTKAYFGPNYTDPPIKQFFYDGLNPSGALSPAAGSNQNGRLSMARSWAPYGNNQHDEYQSYDAMGRVSVRTEVAQSESGTGGHSIAIGYNMAGNVSSLTYPDGRSLTQSYDAAGRLQSITDGNGTSYMSSVSYFPNGYPNLTISGPSISQQNYQNSRLQLCQTSYGNQFGTLMNRQYFFGSGTSSSDLCGSAAGNNGNVLHVLDGSNNAYAQHYVYDSFNRLYSWNGSSPSGAVHNQTFPQDSFGNLQQSNGYPPSSGPDPLTWPTPATQDATQYPAFDSNNRLSPKWSHCIPFGVSGSVGSVSPYSATGSLLCSGTDQVDAKSFAFNEENQLVLMWAEQNNNAYALQSLYSFDSSGQRIRADQYSLASGQTDWSQYPNAHPNWREYTYWNGNVLAEKDQNGVWTDYIYGNGRKIAMAGQQEQVLQVAGSYSGGWQGVGFTVAAPSLTNYVFRAGDVLLVRQRKYGANVHGGILVYADGIASLYNDQDGQRADDDTLGDGSWHNRRIPLDGLQGHTYSGLSMGGGTSTDYNFQFASVAVSSADGTVRTVFSGEAEGTGSGTGGINTGSAAFVPVAADSNAVHFYAQDQVGTSQMEVSAAGYPIWKGEFAPFGQQLDQNPTVNRYKFTGKERDQESGLDYFGARYYASSMGRWMSPDWADKPEAVPYSDLANPQSLNLYGYVRNNPLSQADKDGHDCCTLDQIEATSQATVDASIAYLAVAGKTVSAGLGAAAGAAGLVLQQVFAPQALGDPAETKFLADQASRSEHHETTPEPQVATDGAGARQGGGKMTDHGQQRADEAKAGDTHRQVGDANKVVAGGKTYTDSDTGHTVHVDGNRVVITNSQGERVTQFKNSRANTQQRIQDGKWVPNQ